MTDESDGGLSEFNSRSWDNSTVFLVLAWFFLFVFFCGCHLMGRGGRCQTPPRAERSIELAAVDPARHFPSRGSFFPWLISICMYDCCVCCL